MSYLSGFLVFKLMTVHAARTCGLTYPPKCTWPYYNCVCPSKYLTTWCCLILEICYSSWQFYYYYWVKTNLSLLLMWHTEKKDAQQTFQVEQCWVPIILGQVTVQDGAFTTVVNRAPESISVCSDCVNTLIWSCWVYLSCAENCTPKAARNNNKNQLFLQYETRKYLCCLWHNIFNRYTSSLHNHFNHDRRNTRSPSAGSGAPWRRSVSRDLANDIEKVFNNTPTASATLPRGNQVKTTIVHYK